MKTMRMICIFLIFFSSSFAYAEEQGGGAAEMARKLQDPLANISAFMTDNDLQFRSGKEEDTTSYSFQLQPVYAFDFPDQGFTFLPRAVIPVIGAASGSNLKYTGITPEAGGTTWGLSDIVTQFFFAPKIDGSWKWGLGPQLSWKTRTDDIVGGPGWGAGLSGVVVGSVTKQISFAGIINQLWSYDGDYSTMGFQPNLYYNLQSIEGAFIAYNSTITANWEASSDDVWTVPLGLYAGRMFALGGGYGVEVGLGPYWNVIKPDGAADWSLKFQINFMLPK